MPNQTKKEIKMEQEKLILADEVIQFKYIRRNTIEVLRSNSEFFSVGDRLVVSHTSGAIKVQDEGEDTYLVEAEGLSVLARVNK